MAYNKAREERKWRQWKEEEEKQMRDLGMDEESIQKLRESDWKNFKAERIYQNHRADYSEHPKWKEVDDEELEIIGINGVLDVVSDSRIFYILKEADRTTLQIIISKMMGFSVREIAEKMRIPEQTIYTRLNRLKKKIKNFSESE